MTFLFKIELPFRPGGYLVVSKTGLLVFEYGKNRNGFVDLEKRSFVLNKSPIGTTNNKMLQQSCIFESDDGFVFFPIHTLARERTFLYLPFKNKFKRIDIKLPNPCFTFGNGKYGVFYLQDEEGNLEACSFKTAYEKGAFVPQMKVGKEPLSNFVDVSRIDDLPCQVAYLSVEKGILILVLQDKPDSAAFLEYVNNLGTNPVDPSAFDLIKHRDSGKIVLIKDGVAKRVIEMDKTPFKVYSQPFSDSILFVSHGDILDAYSTDDLTLLTSLPSSAIGHRSFFLPDGRMIYEMCGDTYVTDSSPLAVATKKLKESKQNY